MNSKSLQIISIYRQNKSNFLGAKLDREFLKERGPKQTDSKSDWNLNTPVPQGQCRDTIIRLNVTQMA